MNKQMNSALSTGDNTPVILNGVSEDLHIISLDGQAMVSSRFVAEKFGKEHRNVLQSIDELIKGVAEKSADLFKASNYQHPQNKQWYPEYLMNRDGFTLLAMGFTGKGALEWKLKYIDAFNIMENYIKEQKKPTSAMEELRLHYKALEEHTQEIQEVKQDVSDLKDNMPLFNVECKELQSLVKKKGTEVLGGYHSKAYDDQSIRTKVYSDIQKQLRREFGVSRYEAIKHSQLDVAKQIIAEYKAPLCLVTEIGIKNCQVTLSQVVKPVQPIQLQGGQA